MFDRHVYGLFATQLWVDVCRAAGFGVQVVSRPLPDEYADSAYTEDMFLLRKP